MPVAATYGQNAWARPNARGSQTLPLRIVCQAYPPLSLESVRKIAIFVEPSPFSHVSGMKIRFSNLIKGLREIGDEVTVVTPCVNPPKTYCGAKVSLR